MFCGGSAGRAQAISQRQNSFCVSKRDPLGLSCIMRSSPSLRTHCAPCLRMLEDRADPTAKKTGIVVGPPVVAPPVVAPAVVAPAVVAPPVVAPAVVAPPVVAPPVVAPPVVA